MTTWTLIMTLTDTECRSNGVGTTASVHSVSGFSDEVMCEKAGEKWKSNTRNYHKGRVSYVCVQN